LFFASAGPQDHPVDLTGPPWSAVVKFQGVKGITFRWRTDPAHQREGRVFFQFEFVNTSVDSLRFSYLLVTELRERIFGTITLGPGQPRFSGWYFKGWRIDQVEVVQPDLLPRLLKEGAR
jgi:hypothetical protein